LFSVARKVSRGRDAAKSSETLYAWITDGLEGPKLGKVKTEIKTDILVEFISS
jgi:hypothetical protein